MRFDEIIISGYVNQRGFYQMHVHHDRLVPEGGAVKDMPITAEQIAEVRARYEGVVTRSRAAMRTNQAFAARRNQTLHGIANELRAALETDSEDLQALYKLCERFISQWGKTNPPPTPIDYTEMLALGKAMRAMFPGSSLNVLVGGIKRARSATPQRGLRVILEVEADAQALLGLPWELLVVESEPVGGVGHFLFLSGDTIFIRRVKDIGVNQPLPLVAPVATQIFAAPLKGSPIDTDLFLEALKPLHADHPVEAWWSTDPDVLQTMRERLTLHKPQVVQLICHGRRSQTLQSVERSDLLLTYVDNGETIVHRVSPYDLFPVLRRAPQLQILILTVCDSGQAELLSAHTALVTNIAYELVRLGIPMVIAMQGKITQTAAAHFSEVFYAALQRGEVVEQALIEARMALNSSRWGLDWTMPVVYSGSGQRHDHSLLSRFADHVETLLFAPQNSRRARTGMIALSSLLIAASLLRWLIVPSSLRVDIPALQMALWVWTMFGMLCPLIVSVLLQPERQLLDDPDERRMTLWAHFGGAMLGYMLGSTTALLVIMLLYTIGEVIPAPVWQIILPVVMGWALLTGVVGARSQARGAQANYKPELYKDFYGGSLWSWLIAGMSLFLLLPSILLGTDTGQALATLVLSPHAGGIILAAMTLIIIRNLETS